MLINLRISNLAIVEKADVTFGSGLNIISGETGAGKSILLQAISLLLGSRGGSDLVQSGSDNAVVEGLFDISDLPSIKLRLNEYGFEEAEDSQFLVKRIISKNGRHKVYINGQLATRQILRTLCEGLVDLCGQHEHQSLLKPNIQMSLLDQYGGLSNEAQSFSELLEARLQLLREIEKLRSGFENLGQHLEFLRFQIAELETAGLTPGEDEELEVEKKKLSSAKARLDRVTEVCELVEAEEDYSVASLLNKARSTMEHLLKLDESSKQISDSLESAIAHVEVLQEELTKYRDAIELDDERLLEVEERLATLARLKRKFGTSIEGLVEKLEALRDEEQKMAHYDQHFEELNRKVSDLESKLGANAKKLSQKRSKVSKTFEDSITEELAELNMADAKFLVGLELISDVDHWTKTLGPNVIDFKVQTNAGHEAKPLSKIASGGELSRMMLAVRRVISEKGQIGVYLFDEIDAGIGGKTAFKVGKKLKSVSKGNQVICITHLPQVAAFSDHHFCVVKTKKRGRTLTDVVELPQKGKKEEIARMLGGDQLTPASLKNAAELLDMAR